MTLTHGGDWVGYWQQYGSLPLDFSANVSPLGLPEAVKQAAFKALAEADRYPDPLCRALRGKLAHRYGLETDQVICGNGASDLLYRLVLARRPQKALLTAPTFSEYEQAFKLVFCSVEHFPLREENGFHVTEEILEQITPDLDLLILCEPNNPTGVTTPMPLLLAILERCESQGVLLVVDECFNALLDQPEAHTLASRISSYDNLLVLNAFTKSHAMAGLRLGFALSRDRSLLEAMQQAGPPWSVSHVAQSAGLAALEDNRYAQRLHDLLEQERPRLKLSLEQLGCKVVAGEANYLLFFREDADLCLKLREHGVLIRDCSCYPGLSRGYYRVAVRSVPENDRLISTLKEVLYG